MYDKEKIIPGLLIFIALATFPIWYGLVSAGDAPKPEVREDLKGTKSSGTGRRGHSRMPAAM